MEKECNKVCLGLNARKTRSLTLNIDGLRPLHTATGTELEIEDEFKHLGSWVHNTEKDIKVRKAQAWKALHDMSRVWKSNLKIRFFIATRVHITVWM
jgi:hypothetical protein